jgi:glycerol-3-phosphate cytidylyltransferase
MFSSITLGTFDLPHYGHYRLLKRRMFPDRTVIGLNTHEFITRYKGKPPVMTYEERKQTLEEWGYHVVPNDQADGSIKNALELAGLDKNFEIFVGSDWLEKDYVKQVGLTRQYLYDHDITITIFPYTEGISTSELKRRLNQ